MKKNFDIHRDVWGPYMTLITNMWALSVFKPLNTLQKLDIHINNTIGLLPEVNSRQGSQLRLTKTGIFFKQLSSTLKDQEKVKYFDICAEEYQLATKNFKLFYLDRAFEIIKSQIKPSSYILDVACGAGHELIHLQKLVTKGEVIGLDLSLDMIKRAYRNATLEKLTHVGFYHADINNPPIEFLNHFDMVFCNISLHYFETIDNVFKQFYKALRKNGKLIIIEPVGSVTQKLTQTTLKKAIPHFKRFYNQKKLQLIIERAGFTFQYWEEIQKGIGLTIAIK